MLFHCGGTCVLFITWFSGDDIYVYSSVLASCTHCLGWYYGDMCVLWCATGACVFVLGSNEDHLLLWLVVMSLCCFVVMLILLVV